MFRLGRRYVRALISLGIGLSFLFPLYIALVTSLDTKADVFQFPPHLTLDGRLGVYVRAWNMFPWMMYFGNTLFIAFVTILIALATSVLAAYALSFIEFRGREWVFSLILVVMMIPSEAHLIPNFVILAMMNLIDTYWAQILPYGASVFGIFLLRQFFLSLPKDYWDAARIDGCGHLRYLWSVALPLSRPILFTVSLYIFIGSWNSLMWPLMVTQSHNVQPVEVALAHFLDNNSVDWRRLSAASLFTTMPVILLFLLLQRYIIRGISRGEGIQG
ncbi:carbohydrate ABC transporter permease [Ferroacidibacillus organovorans]|uniref:ABC transporter permease n=1 Tax=Ferroacidibacillus organovorans TaxID=1765683 RepID=A0A161QGQ0_9BACL|nr:carbohydrate ABC transporter permease [Ferroacidibacillus organovorans]KYP81300.1 ABC transporter permease [Ferroacidibacillus organovorans]OAG95303.1 ABC transporter permease [Ferroacidibacillus organovorans]OPG17154.1 ABC transporter permease [Ferroacidibacillus organovorans]